MSWLISFLEQHVLFLQRTNRHHTYALLTTEAAPIGNNVCILILNRIGQFIGILLVNLWKPACKLILSQLHHHQPQCQGYAEADERASHNILRLLRFVHRREAKYRFGSNQETNSLILTKSVSLTRLIHLFLVSTDSLSINQSLQTYFPRVKLTIFLHSAKFSLHFNTPFGTFKGTLCHFSL